MRKTFITLTLLVGCIFASQHAIAQTDSENSAREAFASTTKENSTITYPEKRKVGFGLRGSVNFASLGGNFDNIGGGIYDTGSKAGFSGGFIIDIPLTNNLYLQPGTFLSLKGFTAEAKAYVNAVNYKEKTTASSLYFQEQILLSPRIDLDKKYNIQLQINAGLYLAVGVSGTIKVEEYENGYKSPSTEADYFDDGGFKAFDAGLVLGTAVTFDNFYIGMQYEIGLVNTAEKQWTAALPAGKDPNFTNRNLSVGIGINF